MPNRKSRKFYQIKENLDKLVNVKTIKEAYDNARRLTEEYAAISYRAKMLFEKASQVDGEEQATTLFFLKELFEEEAEPKSVELGVAQAVLLREWKAQEVKDSFNKRFKSAGLDVKSENWEGYVKKLIKNDTRAARFYLDTIGKKIFKNYVNLIDPIFIGLSGMEEALYILATLEMALQNIGMPEKEGKEKADDPMFR